MNANFFAIVEEQEFENYAKYIDRKNLLVLDLAYKRSYETLDNRGDSLSYGPGPARNFAWDHARSQGYDWHWVMDDNIRSFYIWNNNEKIRCYNSSFFLAMEQFCERYSNIAMAGPQYEMFIPRKRWRPLYSTNTRIYSCNLIRNNLPYRWRGRFNEDTILSLDMLKDGWCTVIFNVFLQQKISTQTLPGGNTDEFYRKGTANKSQMLFDVYPQFTRLIMRYGRPHHLVDYRRFTQTLVREKNYSEIVASQQPLTFIPQTIVRDPEKGEIK